MPLFDVRDRNDPSPCGELEDSFAFLNRVDGPFWGEVRRLLEDWFGRYPEIEQRDLRNAFRSRLPGQHLAAWWELYLHELFLRLGYRIEIHPELDDSQHRPDFLLSKNGSQLYVEAAILFSGSSTGNRRGAPSWMLDAINHVTSPNFFLRLVEVKQRGPDQLRRAEIVNPLENWLGGLDPDEISINHELGDPLPVRVVSCRDWEIVFEAWPVKAEARGKPRRALGIGPIQAGYVDDIGQLASTLKKKAGRYGHPEIPMVTAVQCLSAFMEPLDIEQALFGREAVQVSVEEPGPARLVRQRNGFWAAATGPQNQRVSAVLISVGLHSANVGKVAPSLWINPWANYSLDEQWPFAEFTATDQGQIHHQERYPNMSEIFSIPEEWPGGEPFPRE